MIWLLLNKKKEKKVMILLLKELEIRFKKIQEVIQNYKKTKEET